MTTPATTSIVQANQNYRYFTQQHTAFANEGFIKAMTTTQVNRGTYNIWDVLNTITPFEKLKEVNPNLFAIYNGRDLNVKELPEEFFVLVEEYLAKGGDVNFPVKFTTVVNDESHVICSTFFTTMTDWFSTSLKTLKRTVNELDLLEKTHPTDYTKRAKEAAEIKARIKILEKNVSTLRNVIKRLLYIDTIDVSPRGFSATIKGGEVYNVLNVKPLTYIIEADDVDLFEPLREKGAVIAFEDESTCLYECVCTNMSQNLINYIRDNVDIFTTDYRGRSYIHLTIDTRNPFAISSFHERALKIWSNFLSDTYLGDLLKRVRVDLITLIADYAFSADFFSPTDNQGLTPFASFIIGVTRDKEREQKCIEEIFRRGGRSVINQVVRDYEELILTDPRSSLVLEMIQKFDAGKIKEEDIENIQEIVEEVEVEEEDEKAKAENADTFAPVVQGISPSEPKVQAIPVTAASLIQTQSPSTSSAILSLAAPATSSAISSFMAPAISSAILPLATSTNSAEILPPPPTSSMPPVLSASSNSPSYSIAPPTLSTPSYHSENDEKAKAATTATPTRPPALSSTVSAATPTAAATPRTKFITRINRTTIHRKYIELTPTAGSPVAERIKIFKNVRRKPLPKDFGRIMGEVTAAASPSTTCSMTPIASKPSEFAASILSPITESPNSSENKKPEDNKKSENSSDKK